MILKLFRARLSAVSWRYKLLLLGALPTVVAMVCVLIAGITLSKQSSTVYDALQYSKEKQHRATEALTSILELQKNMQTLIAADEPSQVRTYAIATIKSSSALDEASQRLQEALPDSEKVKELRSNLESIRPLQMQVLTLGKQNKDVEAMAVVNDTADQAAAIVELASTILADEQQGLQSLAEQNQEDAHQLILTLLAVAAGGFLLVSLIALMFANRLVSPLKMLQHSMKAFSAGDLSVNLNYRSGDEVGETVAAFYQAVHGTREMVQRISAEGRSLRDQAQQVTAASLTSSQQAAKVQSNAAAVLEKIDLLVSLSQQVEKKLCVSTEESETASREAAATSESINFVVEQFSKLREKMTSLSERIADLSHSATTIGSITETIRAVSEQTNLLALNAAIEAARAGEQGRGFAVVADEVRTLARRSNDAVEKISELASAMSASVANAVDGVDSAVELTERNVEGLKKAAETTRLASNTSSECREQILQVQDMNREQVEVTDDIRNFANELRALADETTRAVHNQESLAASLERSSTALGEAVSQFKQ
jgi:methyl-accepting chemotaxis protein